MTLLIGLGILSYRRLMHIPKLVLTVPFVTFAMTTLFVMGLALSSFANLGVLARQKALVFPFLLLVVCLPELPRRPKHDPEGERQNNSTSPSVSPQLLSGGMPRSLTARHVSTGPPPGNGTKPDDDLWAPRRMA